MMHVGERFSSSVRALTAFPSSLPIPPLIDVKSNQSPLHVHQLCGSNVRRTVPARIYHTKTLISPIGPLQSPSRTAFRLTLNKRRQNLTTRLQQRVSHHNLQKPLKALATVLNNVVGEAVGEHLAGQWRDGDSCGFALEDVAEVLKVGVAAADGGLFYL